MIQISNIRAEKRPATIHCTPRDWEYKSGRTILFRDVLSTDRCQCETVTGGGILLPRRV
ncbi:hypothetical protein C8Q78DRAFT_1059720 [Trametes maxima]|nr:hypothetical protein C8Q78DRAFT_1059720 [Trametes maxima]